MSEAKTTTITNLQQRAEKKPQSIAQLMADPKIKSQMALALPKHLSADRLARIATTEIRKVPQLAKCDQTSFLGAIMQCAQLGLEPGGALGHAYLLPFNNRKANKMEVQFIVGYRGMIDLARRSGQIVSISARAVHQGDAFNYEFGLEESLTHKPADSGKPGPITHVYAVARLKDGGVQFEVMSKAQVDEVRAQSKAGNGGPWVSHYEEMAKKTVIRRLFKYLPVSIEMQQAIGLDERASADISQDNASVLTGEYEVVEEMQPGDDKPLPGGWEEILSEDEKPVDDQPAAVDTAPTNQNVHNQEQKASEEAGELFGNME